MGRGLWRAAAALLACMALGWAASVGAAGAAAAAGTANCSGTTTVTCAFSYTGTSQTFAPPAAVPTTTTASAESVVAAPNAQQVQLRASVTSVSGVDVGSVTFTVEEATTVLGAPVTAPVRTGVATASYLLPASVPAGAYVIEERSTC